MNQYHAAQAIIGYQSKVLSYESRACLIGEYEEKQYYSCRHRSCPGCHGAEALDWQEKTGTRLLPCDHYPVLFALTHNLKPVWHFNWYWCSNTTLNVAPTTLRKLLKDKWYLRTKVGLLSSLHIRVWALSFHPHVNALVSVGGLSDHRAWQLVRNNFLLPVGVLKAKYRGKWLMALVGKISRSRISL